NQALATSGAKRPSFTCEIIVPIIVTTADLIGCVFSPGHVDLATGNLPFDKARLVPQKWVVLEYAVPVALQYGPKATIDIVRGLTTVGTWPRSRMHTTIVNSLHLEALLDNLYMNAEEQAKNGFQWPRAPGT